MKYFAAILVYLCLTVTISAQNDCPEALAICGDGDYIGLSALGPGTQEVQGTSDCQSREHNSIWLKLTIKTGGTLGFVLTPANEDLVVDFDFFIYGPDVPCNNIGWAVRCSTTNPLQAGSTSNLTGMNDIEPDEAEGPGEDGNNFINWFTVQDDEVYYLVIDRPEGDGDFSIHWTGTARFHPIPVFNNPNSIPTDLTVCDTDGNNDGISQFDLTTHAAMFIGDQEDVILTYHHTIDDVNTGHNQISTATPYTNSVNGETILMRMTNSITGCYSIEEFRLFVNSAPVYINPQNITLDLTACDTDGSNDGSFTFNLTTHAVMLTNGQDVSLSYHTTQEDANSGANPVLVPAVFVNTQNPQVIYMRMANNSTGCYSIKQFNLIVNMLPDFVNPNNISINLFKCDDDAAEDGLTVFDLTRHRPMLTAGQNNLSITYYTSLSEAQTGNDSIVTPQAYINTANPQTIYMRLTNTDTGCVSTSSFEINVRPKPVFINPQNIQLNMTACDTDGVADGTFTFNLTQHRDMLIGTQPNAVITYHQSLNDAQTGANDITTPSAYANTANTQIIYMRLTDTATNCFVISSFVLRVNPVPVFNNPQNIAVKLEECDRDLDDKSYIFNLTQHEQMFKGSQANMFFSYYTSGEHASAATNAIVTPSSFRNTANPQTVFVRMYNNVTGCVSITSFDIEVVELLDAGEPANLAQCDTSHNGLQLFNLAQNDAALKDGNAATFVRYYSTEADAENEVNQLPSLYQNAEPYTTETIWARLENVGGCIGFDIKSFTISILDIPEINFTTNIVDFSSHDNAITITIADPENYEYSIDGVNYFENPTFTDLEPGVYKVYVRSKNKCTTAHKEVVILNYPKFFTPNGDGINEHWQVHYLFLYPKARVTILDRYGKIITSFGGTSAGWDGIYNNRRLPATDYWFVLELEGGRIVKGHFSLIR